MPREDTQFKPGNNRNPKGRPKKEYCLTDILKSQGEIIDVETDDGKISRKQAIAKKLWSMAMAGDVIALKYIYDRVDGKSLQQIEAKIETDANVYIGKEFDEY